jgi:hypothetical protein
MATLLKHSLAACFALAAASLCAVPAYASPETNHPKATTVLKKQAKGAKKKSAEQADVFDEKNDPEPDITDTLVTEYKCELNNKVTIYKNENDTDHIALRWKNRVHRMSRVGTTTGAQRFENPVFGIIWIGIPAKGILLDSRHNHQLANECKDAQQSKPMAFTAAESKQG